MSESYSQQPPETGGKHVAEGCLTYIYGGQSDRYTGAYQTSKRIPIFPFETNLLKI